MVQIPVRMIIAGIKIVRMKVIRMKTIRMKTIRMIASTYYIGKSLPLTRRKYVGKAGEIVSRDELKQCEKGRKCGNNRENSK